MARMRGCRLQLANGQTVPIMDSDLNQLANQFAVSALICLEHDDSLEAQKAIQAAWIDCHAAYLVYISQT